VSIHVHPPGEADLPRIREVLSASFPTAAEADLVERLGADGHLAISLVATVDDAVVGFVGFSRMAVTADGEAVRALGLGPVAVLPDQRRRGIGERLIQQGLAAANGRGVSLVFVTGDRDFYGRFGFRRETAAPFASIHQGPHLLAQWLSRPRVPASGTADYPPAFAALG
jgi:predicted N-acetyltransferase YhbS